MCGAERLPGRHSIQQALLTGFIQGHSVEGQLTTPLTDLSEHVGDKGDTQWRELESNESDSINHNCGEERCKEEEWECFSTNMCELRKTEQVEW